MKSSFIFSFFLAFFLSAFALQAQDDQSAPYGGIQATPKYAWEVGLSGGHSMLTGDVAFVPSWGAGFHIRRAMDYVFSLRFDASYLNFVGDTENGPITYLDTREGYVHRTTFASASGQVLITLNNLRWDKPVRKVNLYVFVGAGASYSKTAIDFKNDSLQDLSDVVIPGARDFGNIGPIMDGGAGIAFRLGPAVNIAFEHKASMLFSRRADYLDGFSAGFRDIPQYTHVRLNFNLRRKGALAEPLYWVNPLDVVLTDISELKERPVLDLTDTDGDGVIDMLDQDNDTPAGVPVDTRGLPLDSDADGVPDYKDVEPFSPPATRVTPDGKAVEGPGKYVTEDELEQAIAHQAAQQGSGKITSWFLPTIHFNPDSYTVRYADYPAIESVARVMKANPDIKVVVKGFTDKTASSEYNLMLSFMRAQSAVELLVNQYDIPRERLLIQYAGEDEPLVPVSGSNYINRRVEFFVAGPDDVEMARPEGRPAGKGSYRGQKESDY